MPYPAYNLIDLAAYHSAGRAHGPLLGPYLPLITSRVGPYNCSFCATPRLSGRRWRGRSPEAVVAEVKFLRDKYGVFDFHIQDDNFIILPGTGGKNLRGPGKTFTAVQLLPAVAGQI